MKKKTIIKIFVFDDQTFVFPVNLIFNVELSKTLTIVTVIL